MKGSVHPENNEGTFPFRLFEPLMDEYSSANDSKIPEKAFLHRSKGKKESGNCLIQKGSGYFYLVILPHNTEELLYAWDGSYGGKPYISDEYLVFRF